MTADVDRYLAEIERQIEALPEQTQEIVLPVLLFNVLFALPLLPLWVIPALLVAVAALAWGVGWPLWWWPGWGWRPACVFLPARDREPGPEPPAQQRLAAPPITERKALWPRMTFLG